MASSKEPNSAYNHSKHVSIDWKTWPLANRGHGSHANWNEHGLHYVVPTVVKPNRSLKLLGKTANMSCTTMVKSPQIETKYQDDSVVQILHISRSAKKYFQAMRAEHSNVVPDYKTTSSQQQPRYTYIFQSLLHASQHCDPSSIWPSSYSILKTFYTEGYPDA